MLRKKIIIKDSGLEIGNKIISWNDIVGIKEYSDKNLPKISNRFPRSELFLKNGAAVAISVQNSFFEQNMKRSDYATSIKMIREKAININPVFENWMSWRMILPIGAFELIVLLLFFLLQRNIIEIINIMLLAGIIGAGIGWVWEIIARRKAA